MKTVLGLFISFFFVINCIGQAMSFECHEIGTFKDRMGQTSLIDIDNDNDLDWVFGRFGEMFWYEYVSSDNWILHELGKGASTDVGGCPHDVNQDGWMDYIVGDSWYENTKKPREETFVIHNKNMINCHDNIVVDIDGDNIKDVVSLSNNPDHPVLCWYKIPEDYTSNWNYFKIGNGIHGGIAPMGYGDLDNDNDVDIVRGNAWFENADGKGQKWTLHENLTPLNGNRPDKFGLALKTWCTDLDKDGDIDVVQAEADTQNGRVFWFENQNKGESFVFHLISKDTTNQDFHSLILADFDGDGDTDICSGGGPLSQEKHKMFIWENKNGDAKIWSEHTILEGRRIHEAIGADVDFDGDIDICAKPWHGGQHIFLENKLIDF
tara:strand:+ start:4276 stop:5412 length:1137 start_codon:yes stop_codon:yes gene_type:complete